MLTPTIYEQKVSKIKFTDLTVAKLKPGVYVDEVTRGFGVRIGKTRRTWFVTRGKQREHVTIGRYPTISLADARKQARKLLAGEPEFNSGITFDDALSDFKDIHCSQKRLRTQRDYLRMFTKHYAPELTGKRLSAITHSSIAAITDRLIDTPSERSHALAVGRTFFRFCVGRRYIPTSPLEGIRLPKTTPRARLLTDEEVKLIWKACEQSAVPRVQQYPAPSKSAASTLPATFCTIVKLLILTGQRRNEIASLKSSWIKENRIVLPASVTKNGREHSFPIGSLVSDLLNSVHKESSGTTITPNVKKNSSHLYFPARGSDIKHFNGWSKAKAALDRRLGGTVAPFTLHDIRRFYASTMARLGVRQEVTERLLNHRSGIISGIAAIYTLHDFLPEMRAAVDQYQLYLERILKD